MTKKLFHVQVVDLSIKPSRVNHEVTFEALKEGMMVTGSVKSDEDRGYVITFGKLNRIHKAGIFSYIFFFN